MPLCTQRRVDDQLLPQGEAERAQDAARLRQLAQQGLSVLAVAPRHWAPQDAVPQELSPAEESELVFEGLCAFADPPKPSAPAAIARLAAAGVRLKILSGDAPIVAQAAADMILLASDLEVVAEGVEEGRRTFVNIHLATFAGLLWLYHATPEAFHTLWFMESMATQILVIFIIRTRALPRQDRPHPALTASSLVALAVALVLPFTPLGGWFGFVQPGWDMLGGMALLVLVYLLCAQLLKGFALSGKFG